MRRSFCVAQTSRTSTSIVSLPPTRSNFRSCKHPQQLDLHDRRDLSDFVEKQRASMGQFKPPATLPQRPREGTLFMAEQFRLEQRFRARPHS